jgi:hypothetical protein
LFFTASTADPIAQALLLIARVGAGVGGEGSGGVSRPTPGAVHAAHSPHKAAAATFLHSLTMERPHSAEDPQQQQQQQQQQPPPQQQQPPPPQRPYEHQMQQQQQQQHGDQATQQDNTSETAMRPAYVGSYIEEDDEFFQFGNPNPNRNQPVPPDEESDDRASHYVGTD